MAKKIGGDTVVREDWNAAMLRSTDDLHHRRTHV